MSQVPKTTDDDRDVIAKLADRGEQTLAKLAELPGGSKALKGFNDLRLRVDDLARKARGVDALEAAREKLEKELAALKRASKPPASKRRRAPHNAGRAGPGEAPTPVQGVGGTRSLTRPAAPRSARCRPGLLAVELDGHAARRSRS